MGRFGRAADSGKGFALQCVHMLPYTVAMVSQVQPDRHGKGFLVTFDPFRHLDAVRHLALVGNFNRWHVEKQDRVVISLREMMMEPVTIPLPSATYEYKYFDLDAQTWLEVEDEPLIYWSDFEDAFVANAFGTQNCVLRLREPDVVAAINAGSANNRKFGKKAAPA